MYRKQYVPIENASILEMERILMAVEGSGGSYGYMILGAEIAVLIL